MKVKVICINSEHGIHDFYLIYGKEKFLLFRQKFRRGVNSYFGKGVTINEAIDTSFAKRDTSILRTMNKIIPWLKYIEKEEGIMVLDKTIKKNYGEIRYA